MRRWCIPACRIRENMCTYRSGLSVAGLLVLLSYGSNAQTSALSISSEAANNDGTTAFSFALSVSGTAPSGLEWTMAYSPGQASGVSFTTGPSAAAALKTLSCQTGSTSATCLLTGLNTDQIGSGVVAYLNATVAAGTTTGSIQISNPALAWIPWENSLASPGCCWCAHGDVSVVAGFGDGSRR